MKFKDEQLNFEDNLIKSCQTEIHEISYILKSIKWYPEFSISVNNNVYFHQNAYNKAFEIEFKKHNWDSQPKLKDSPRLIGDFKKSFVFVEIQFGNSSTLYRDFYKFQYGFQNKLLLIAVLIVPYNELDFFPTRPNSVNNMANFKLANNIFTIIPINVPTWIIGLLAEN